MPLDTPNSPISLTDFNNSCGSKLHTGSEYLMKFDIPSGEINVNPPSFDKD